MPNQSKRYGEKDFLEQAMQNWGDAVYRLALSQTRSRVEAEDVYQDVFLRLFKSRTSFESDEHVKAWLLRVTVNCCRDLTKSAWKRRTVALDPAWDVPESPARSNEESDVWDAVGRLPDRQRAALHLYYVEGYSTQEIADLLGCEPATTRTLLSRARMRVKNILEAGTTEETSLIIGESDAEGGAAG